MLLYGTLAVLCCVHAVTSFPLNDYGIEQKRDVDPALVPSFGWQAGINPDGTGNCDGAVNGTNGKPILVPCQCPPNSTFFLTALNKNIAAGFATTNPIIRLTFPTDNSTASQFARLNAAAVTLQNLEGPGIGCPISSTTFETQYEAIGVEESSAHASAIPSSASPSAPTLPGPSSNTSYTNNPGPTPTPAVTPFPPLPSSPSPSTNTSCTSSPGPATTPAVTPLAPTSSSPSTSASQTSDVGSITTPAVTPSPLLPSSPSTNTSYTSSQGSATTPAVTPLAPAPSSPSTSASQTSGVGPITTPAVFPSPSSNTNPTSTTSNSSNSTTPTDEQIAALAPLLGWKSGIHPDGAGNCDGAVNGTDGKPILIPCQCPPEQSDYIANLTANIRARHAILNPTVPVTFPTDNSTASKLVRLNAAAITIQNLVGIGKGCPISSTNFMAQAEVIIGEDGED